jgi:hypothetical protein
MDRKTVEQFAEFLAKDYGSNILVSQGFCPKCFTDKHSEKTIIKTFQKSVQSSPTSNSQVTRNRFNLWMELFTNGGVDPIQVINAYMPTARDEKGKVVREARFRRSILNLKKPGKTCEKECEAKCLICDSHLGHLPTYSIDGWTVHDICSSKCGFIPCGAAKSACCKRRTLAIPLFFEDNLKMSIRCSDHRIQDKQPQSSLSVATKHSDPSPPAPIHKDPPKHVPKPPAKRKLLKIERVRESGNHDIAKMMFPEQYDKPEPKKPRQDAKPQTVVEIPGSSSGRLGASFLYGKSHGFDFTPPMHIQQPSSDNHAHQTNDDKASAGTSDGEH